MIFPTLTNNRQNGDYFGIMRAMLIKKNQAKIVNQETKIIKKYTAPDKQLEINHMILNGRTPKKEGTFLCESKLHWMLFVIKGKGKIFLNDDVFEIKEGDCVDFPPGSKFAAEGHDFEYITVESPAWYPEQAKIVDKEGNVLRN